MSDVTESNGNRDDPMEIDEVASTTGENGGTNEITEVNDELDREGKNITDKLREVSPHLPISKLKKIARSDPEYILTASSAFVAAAFATELFVQSITEEMLALSHLSSKNTGGKNVRLTYDNIAECVSRRENYQFLEDVVPKTKNLRTLVKQNRVRYSAATSNGQSTLPFGGQVSADANGRLGKAGIEKAEEEQDTENATERDDNEDNIDDEDKDDDEDEDEDEDQEQEEEDEEVKQQLKEIEKLNRVEDIDKDQDEDPPVEELSENDD